MGNANFWKNTSGNVGVIFAIAALPIMVGSTLAMDKYKANSVQADLQAATDNAVLATVSNGALDPGDRQSYAESRFASNYKAYPATLKYSDTASVVQLTATAKMPTLMGSIVGRDNILVSATAAGTVSRGRTICVLALSEDSESAMSFSDSVLFEASNCSVHVNSKHANAITSTSTMTPKAQDFCVTGSGTGTFNPPLNSECTKVNDPYADLVFPTPTQCVEDAATRGQQLYDTLTTGFSQMGTTYSEEDATTTGSNTVLRPGTYCDPVIVDGANVTFSPGTYQFLAGIKFKNSAQVHAQSVTLVLHGPENMIEVETGAQVYLKAPASGDLAGLAIIQGEQSYVGLGNQILPAGRWVGVIRGAKPISRLNSGGHLDVIGTVYLPDQHLDVSGTSTFGARSRSTSFIADTVSFSEKTRASLTVNHTAEGLPPIEPRVEEAPRLIK